MNEEIKFYIPEFETIPTKLRLKKGNIQIIYKRCEDNFAYEFDIYELNSEQEGKELVKEIANQMCLQSYDHGQEWIITDIEIKECEINNLIKHGTWIVKFRIKDIY